MRHGSPAPSPPGGGSFRRRLRGSVHHTIATAMASASAISRNTQNTLRPPVGLAALSAIALAIAACTAQPPRAPEVLACPPPGKPVCPAPTEAPKPPLAEARGRLQPASWSALPGWAREPLRPSLEAFVRGCAALDKQPLWAGACAEARALARDAPQEALAAFFERTFEPHQVVNGDGSDTGMVTGYYEPLLRGSRTPSARFRHPLYAPPQDLLVVDLASVYPDLKGRRLRGRLQGNRVVPYFDRAQIDREPAPLGGLEIAWVDDAVDAFFLHIQGSGQVELENGERLRVGYAEQNGHPFRSLGAQLIRSGEIAPERASMQGIREWARRNPARVQEFMNANPSYVFFRELPRDLPGPLGALGVPLTAERSIAVDPRVVPLGAPVYLATTWPNTAQPLNRLMAAQDTGGAIAGAVRADFFWGFGDAAGSLAGRMRQAGRMWVLLPKGQAPEGAAAP
jgi:membrane-bound lytic murein transglycosylase A